MRKRNNDIQLTSYEELLGMDYGTSEDTEKIKIVPLPELHTFKDHPFRVVDDEKMEETTESISKYGVLVPAIARPRIGGGYELIAGHRRKRGSERAGKTEMPVIIRNYILFVKFYASTIFTLFAPIIYNFMVIMQILCSKFFNLFSNRRKQLHIQF